MSNNIARALFATDEAEKNKYVYREVIKAAVVSAIFCQACKNNILDMKSAVLVESEANKTSMVICPGCYDRAHQAIALNGGFKVTAARDLYKKASKKA